MKRFGRMVIAALGIMVVAGAGAHAQTPSQQWKTCRENAFWAAYDCFTDSTTYLGDVLCNTLWDADNTACDVALVKHIVWPT